MMDIPPEYIDLAVKLLIATILGGLIGLEREFHGRDAGLRTHILVCLGATVIMASSQTMQNTFVLQGSESVFRLDPWRLAAGIVTGIGFLGGGTILKSNELIRGLTTAACIWFIASIGIIVGLGLYVPATMATIVGLLVLLGLDPIGQKIPAVKYSQITVISKMEAAEEVEKKCLEILKNHPITLQDTTISADSKSGQRTLILFVRSREIKHKHQILKQIFAIPSVQFVTW